MKNVDFTDEELTLVAKIYQELDPLTLARAQLVLKEVMRLVKEVSELVQERTTLREANDG